MSVELLITLIFAPSLFWFGYFYYHDRFKPEPIVLTGLSYLLGLFSAWMCLGAYETFLPMLSITVPSPGFSLSFLLYCILVVGLVEELFKFLPFWLITRFSDFNEEIDGIFYASVVALGFASYENIQYLPELAGFALFGRAIASPLSHTIFASVWGYPIGKRMINRQPLLTSTLVAISLSALLHGLFDFLTFSAVWRVLGALMLLLLWLWRIKTSEAITAKHIYRSKRENIPKTH